jgi:hypothetical protein
LCKRKNIIKILKKKLMGLNFKFIVIWKALSTMPPKVTISAAGVKPGGFGSAGSKATSSATSPASPKADPKAASVAASVATSPAAPKADPKAAPFECADFNKTGKPCSRGQKCRNEKCRNASKAAATLPKSAVKGGDGGVSAQLSAQLSALQKQFSSMHTKVDDLTKQVATGFTETKAILTEQQQATLGMQKAMEAMMLASASFQSGITGLITGSASRSELPAPAARRAICAPAIEVVERPVAIGGGSSASEVRSSSMAGTHMDALMALCTPYGFPPQGDVYNVLCALFGINPVSDHHKSLLSTISDHTENDALAALLFLLLTGSTQFTKASFDAFRTECDLLLKSNRTSTFTIFSRVCKSFIKNSPKWEIKKKDSVKASNAQLKDEAQHSTAFNALVRNFQS